MVTELNIEQDFEIAAELYRLAAGQGDSWAQYLLGLCYLDGEGVRRNRRWAKFWLSKAAHAGESYASEMLIEMEDPSCE